jgi:T5SS/PEP-CTERM-associated repeat protein
MKTLTSIDVQWSYTLAVVVASLLAALEAAAATNSWTAPVSDRWDTNGAWSLLVRPDGSQTVFITNSGTKTVTIDAGTSGSFPGSMTVTNLTVSGRGSATNTLFLNSAGTGVPLTVLTDFTLSSNSLVAVNNSAVQVYSGLNVGASGSNNRLVITNGGRVFVGGSTVIGGVPGFNDSLWLSDSGSSLISTSANFTVRNSAAGAAITVAKGARLLAGNLYIGNSATANGNLVLVTDAGSAWTNFGTLSVGGSSSGAQFIVSNSATAYSANVTIGDPVGQSHSGLVTGSNSLWLSSGSVQVGFGGSNDSLTIAAGGALIVTNNAHSASVILNHSSLVLGPGTFTYDHLWLTNNSSVTASASLVIAPVSGTTSSVTLASSTYSTSSNLVVAPASNSVANVSVSNGAVVMVASTFGLGNDGTTNTGAGIGNATITDGSLAAASMILGSSVGGLGTLNLQSNCVVTVNSNITLLSAATNTPSTITVSAGCSLNASNGTIAIGPSGGGQMTISGGTVIAQRIHLGGGGALGKVVFSAGFVRASELLCNWWVDGGGDMDGSGGTMLLGAADHDSLYEKHAGASTNWNTIRVGDGAGLTGTYTQDGGVVSVTNTMIVGDCVMDSTGVVTMSGSGALYVTNASHTAVLDVRKGSFTLTGGMLVVDILRVTNTCGGAFSHLGGTLQYAQLDVEASGDADGDGQSNAKEVQAGTDPFNAGSVFRLVSIVKTNVQDLRVDWTTVGGHSYVVQTNGDLAHGTFNDLNGAIPVGGTGEGTTNYVHAGAATNRAGFYRVRLQP